MGKSDRVYLTKMVCFGLYNHENYDSSRTRFYELPLAGERERLPARLFLGDRKFYAEITSCGFSAGYRFSMKRTTTASAATAASDRLTSSFDSLQSLQVGKSRVAAWMGSRRLDGNSSRLVLRLLPSRISLEFVAPCSHSLCLSLSLSLFLSCKVLENYRSMYFVGFTISW